MNATFALSDDAMHQIAEYVAALLRKDQQAEPEPWIDADAAAKYLGCNRRRIYDLTAQGRLPFAKDGSRLLFRYSQIDAALEGAV